MSNTATKISDTEIIEKTIQFYINEAKSGKGNDMKPALHSDAAIFDYIGNDLFEGSIQKLFDWNDENGPATELEAKIASIDLVGTVASIRPT